MTFRPHWRFRMEGILGYEQGSTATSYSFDETFSTGVNFGTFGNVDDDPANGISPEPVVLSASGTAGEAAEVAWLKTKGVAFATALMGAWTNPNARVLRLKLNKIGADGKYVDAVTHLWEAPQMTQVIVGQATVPNYHPHQVAEVVTLHTDRSRGHAARGRMFLPSPSYALQPDGLIVQADRDAHLISLKQAFAAAVTGGATPGTFFGPVVVSGLGAGVLRPVTTLGLGLALDTMRSRRRSLHEGYAQSVAIG